MSASTSVPRNSIPKRVVGDVETLRRSALPSRLRARYARVRSAEVERLVISFATAFPRNPLLVIGDQKATHRRQDEVGRFPVSLSPPAQRHAVDLRAVVVESEQNVFENPPPISSSGRPSGASASAARKGEAWRVPGVGRDAVTVCDRLSGSPSYVCVCARVWAIICKPVTKCHCVTASSSWGFNR